MSRFADALGQPGLGSIAELLTPESYAAVAGRLALRLRGEPVSGATPAHLRRKDGTTVEVELRGRVVEYGGRPAAVGSRGATCTSSKSASAPA